RIVVGWRAVEPLPEDGMRPKLLESAQTRQHDHLFGRVITDSGAELAEPTGQAEVVRVQVGDKDRANGIHTEPAQRQGGLERFESLRGVPGGVEEQRILAR